jgi:hypothetical protein
MENKHTQQVDFSNPNADKITSTSTIAIKQETLEEAKNNAWDNYEHVEGNLYSTSFKNGFEIGAKWNQEQILQFLYSEITERRPYSSSRMCEVVIKFIEQLNDKK